MNILSENTALFLAAVVYGVTLAAAICTLWRVSLKHFGRVALPLWMFLIMVGVSDIVGGGKSPSKGIETWNLTQNTPSFMSEIGVVRDMTVDNIVTNPAMEIDEAVMVNGFGFSDDKAEIVLGWDSNAIVRPIFDIFAATNLTDGIWRYCATVAMLYTQTGGVVQVERNENFLQEFYAIANMVDSDGDSAGDYEEQFLFGTDPDVADMNSAEGSFWDAYDEVFPVGTNTHLCLVEIATSRNDPATLITVGDKTLLTRGGESAAFALEKGVAYGYSTNPLDVDPAFYVNDSDDTTIGPSRLVVDGAATGTYWTIGGGYLDVIKPSTTNEGSILIYPKLLGSPAVNHFYSSQTFEAIFVNTNQDVEVNYEWTTHDSDMIILSPSSRVTQVSFASTPDFGELDLSVTAHFDTNHSITSSARGCTFGRYLEPQIVECTMSVPDVVFLDRGRRHVLLVYDVGIPGFMEVSVDCIQGSDKISIWNAAESGEELSFPVTATGSASFYIQGEGLSYGADDVIFEITCRSAMQGTEYYRTQKSLTVILVESTPLTSEERNGKIINPSGITIGDESTFELSLLPSSFPNERIVWNSEGYGQVDFPYGSTGRVVQVRGVTQGDLDLVATIGDYTENPPIFNAEVVWPFTIDIYAWILSSGGVAAATSNEVAVWVSEASKVWRQVGISFNLAEVVVTNIPSFYDINQSGTNSYLNLVNMRHNTGGLELYAVRSVNGGNARGYGGTGGIIVADNADIRTLAHEIGHAFGLCDIYIDNADFIIDNAQYLEVTNTITRACMNQEWNSRGEKGYYYEGYDDYDSCIGYRGLLKKCLMYGFADNFRGDITYGQMKAVFRNNNQNEDWAYDLAPIGSTDRWVRSSQ